MNVTVWPEKAPRFVDRRHNSPTRRWPPSKESVDRSSCNEWAKRCLWGHLGDEQSRHYPIITGHADWKFTLSIIRKLNDSDAYLTAPAVSPLTMCFSMMRPMTI